VETDVTVTFAKEFAWKTYQEQKSKVPCPLYGVKGNFKWSVLLSSMVKQLHPAWRSPRRLTRPWRQR
jgi:hypothetical protein